MSDRISAKVYVTPSHDKFVAFRGNRGANRAHLRQLIKSMEEYGWLDSMPMTCVKNGSGKLHVLDGHNRLSAAQALGIPAKYVVVNDGLNENAMNTILNLNKSQRSWSSLDQINSFARMGYKQYKIAKEFIDEYGFGVAISLSLLADKPSVSAKEIEGGQFEVSDLVKAQHLANLLSQLRVVLKRSFRVNFTRVFIRAASLEDVSIEHLVEQMIKNPHLVIDYNAYEDVAKMFEDIYNYHKAAKNKIPLAFMIMRSYNQS